MGSFFRVTPNFESPKIPKNPCLFSCNSAKLTLLFQGVARYNLSMYLLDLWKQILTLVSREIPKNRLLTFFARTAIIELTDGVLKIGAPKPTTKAEIETKYQAIVLKCAQEVNPEIQEIHMEIDGTLMDPEDTRAINITHIVSDKKVRKTRNQPEVKIQKSNGNGHTLVSHILDPRYTLDNFVVGKDNRLAHAACVAVSQKPGADYNPLFIYGGVGLGKTHLLQATGNEILSNYPEAAVVYMTAERFMNEYVAAIKKFQITELRNRYRNIDCLAIDDIQFIADKDRTQEFFFHIFNDLRDARKQLIISSDRPPKELAGIEDRLKSRFESGMVVEVYFPDFETRLAILQNKCQEKNVILASDILEFLAMNVHNSVRELEGFVTQVIADMTLNHVNPTMRSVAEMMKRQNGGAKVVGVSEEEMKKITSARHPNDIIHLVAQYYRIPTEKLVGPSRRKEVLLPRQMSMFLIYELLNYSFDTIGDFFQGRNHTTVLHAYHKMKELVSRDQKIASDTLTIKREMGL